MHDRIEQNLLIYKKYTDLKLILYAQKVFEVKDKLNYLNLLDAELMYQRFMIRISYDKKYISQNNYRTWSYKISEIGKMLGGWIKSLLIHMPA